MKIPEYLLLNWNSPSASANDVNATETNSSAGAVIKGRNGLSIELYNTASQELIQKILGACAYAQ